MGVEVIQKPSTFIYVEEEEKEKEMLRRSKFGEGLHNISETKRGEDFKKEVNKNK